MRQSNVRGEHAVRQSRQRLLRRVRMDSAQAALVAGVERLEQIERLGPAYLADENPVRAVAQGRAHEVGDGDGRQRGFRTEWQLRPSGLESQQVRLLEMDFRGFFDHHDAIPVWDPCREGVEEVVLRPVRRYRSF